MPYRLLSTDRTLEAAMRRISGEQLAAALVALEAKGDEQAAAIHLVRRTCKKLRALLRLVRPAFAAYAAEDAALRDIARLLGAARDAKVLHDTFDAVTSGDAAPPGLRSALAAGNGARTDPAELDARFAQARSLVEQVRERARSWSLDADGWDVLGPGLARPYRRARKARKRAMDKPTAHLHHQWRKRVKDHWYHTRLLRGIQPGPLTRRADLARELSELLGEHHDCQVLEDALAAERPAPAAELDPEAAAAVIALARRRRAALEKQAHRLGSELQADKPAELTRRWGAWWDAWRRDIRQREAGAAANGAEDPGQPGGPRLTRSRVPG